jgi:hypothetical protein
MLKNIDAHQICTKRWFGSKQLYCVSWKEYHHFLDKKEHINILKIPITTSLCTIEISEYIKDTHNQKKKKKKPRHGDPSKATTTF